MTPQDQMSISGPAYSLPRPAWIEISIVSCCSKGVVIEPGLHSLPADNLWRRIIRTPTARLQEISIGHDITQSEITDLDVEVVVQ
jgi:hypothetical protein